MNRNTPKRVVILGRSVATVGESLQEGTACNTPDLLSPSGPVLERVKPTEPAILEMVRAHYSHKCNTWKRPRTAKTSKTWWSNAKLIVYSDPERTFVFAWQWPRAEFRRDKQSGFNNTLFHRTERCRFKASEVLLAAEQAVVAEWGENRAYTYIDPEETKEIKVRGERVIGFAYLKAGWRFVKIAESGKHLFEKQLLLAAPKSMRSARENGLPSQRLLGTARIAGETRQNSSASNIELFRPSGPFPFASDEELEAIEAEQAGRYPYA